MSVVRADDMSIKLWDWEKKWQCSQVFEGHSHYVMMIVLNPKDNNQFASASLDRTIKVSQLLRRGGGPWTALTPAPVIRSGNSEPTVQTSLWKATRKASTALITSKVATNLISFLEQMTGVRLS